MKYLLEVTYVQKIPKWRSDLQNIYPVFHDLVPLKTQSSLLKEYGYANNFFNNKT